MSSMSNMSNSENSKIEYKDIQSISDNELIEYYHTIKDEMEYQDSMSLSFKVFLNSNYGSNTLPQNTFSNGRLTSASVTTSGRLLIQSVAMELSNEVSKYLKEEQNPYMNYVVQSDTDSSYIILDDLVQKYKPDASEEEILKFIQSFYKKKLAVVIQNVIDKIAKKMNLHMPEVIKMDQEIVSNSFVSIASKRYFARVIMSDGNKLSTPKSKMTGISLVSKSTPSGVKNIMYPILDFILDHNESALQKYIIDNHDTFLQLPVSKICKPFSVTSIDKYSFTTRDNTPSAWKNASKFAYYNEEGRRYQTAPVNSKAAAVHSLLVDELDLSSKYEKIAEADKMYMVYLKVPNKVTGLYNNTCAFKDPRFIEDAGLTEYVDYDIQWQKEVVDKANLLLQPIGLEAKKTKVDLDEW